MVRPSRLQRKALPQSGLGQACVYLLGHWAPLTAHLQHSQTRLDNNLVENAIRPSAIGKKNWLFIGHPGAGQRSAIIYSLVVSCQRHGKDPLAYLRDVLTRLPTMTNQDDLSPLHPGQLATVVGLLHNGYHYDAGRSVGALAPADWLPLRPVKKDSGRTLTT